MSLSIPSDPKDYFQLLSNLVEMCLSQLLFLPWDKVHRPLITDFLCEAQLGNFRSSTQGSPAVCTLALALAIVSEVYQVKEGDRLYSRGEDLTANYFVGFSSFLS